MCAHHGDTRYKHTLSCICITHSHMRTGMRRSDFGSSDEEICMCFSVFFVCAFECMFVCVCVLVSIVDIALLFRFTMLVLLTCTNDVSYECVVFGCALPPSPRPPTLHHPPVPVRERAHSTLAFPQPNRCSTRVNRSLTGDVFNADLSFPCRRLFKVCGCEWVYVCVFVTPE